MIDSQVLSNNKKRNCAYNKFLLSPTMTVNSMIKLANRLMRKERLHRHFFFKPTFLERLFGALYMLPTARYLVFFALDLPHEYHNRLYTDKIITKEEAMTAIKVVEKRISERCPVEYITNECWYLDRKFYVNQNVLVPRSLMSTQFNKFLNEMTWENNQVLDLCTGSGCIGITLALLNPAIKVDLADLSANALEVAKINIDRYHLQDRVRCIQSDLFANIHNKYDLIITNPPYVASKLIGAGPMELKREPHMALDGGADGLTLIDKILQQAKSYLTPHGKLIAEVGFTAPKKLKKRYPRISKWLSPKPEAGEESIFDFFLYSGDSIFQCDAKDLD